jgi:hypothetical protein
MIFFVMISFQYVFIKIQYMIHDGEKNGLKKKLTKFLTNK